MQLADLLFAAAQIDGLVLEARSKVARDQRDQEKQDQIDYVLRIADPEGVKRRIKEEIRRRGAGYGRNDSGPDTPLCRRHHHRQHVNQRDEV